MKLEEIIDTLKQLTEEVEKIREVPSKERGDGEKEKKWQRIAKSHTFSTHILRECEENVRKDYMAILFSIFGKEEKEEVRKKRLLFLYRILFSFDEKADVLDYVTRSMKVDEEALDRFLSIINKEVSFYFAVDLLMLGMMVGSEDRMGFREIADILEIIKLDGTEIKKAVKVARAIVEQDFYKLLLCGEKRGIYGYDRNFGYLSEKNDMKNSDKQKRIIRTDNEVLFINQENADLKEFIDFDEYKEEEIVFYKCEFRNIRGIRNFKKRVTFMECCFKDIVYDHFFYVESYMNTVLRDGVSKVLYSFIQGQNYMIIKTKFQKCKSASLIDVSDSRIEGCKFEDCEGYFRLEYMDSKNGDIFYSYFLKLEKTIIEKCEFSKCFSASHTPYPINLTNEFMGLVFINDGEMKNCKFINCDVACIAYSHLNYYFDVIFAKKSVIEKNSFDEISIKYSHELGYLKSSSILRLDVSEEIDNKFGYSLCKDVDKGELFEQKVKNIERK